MTAQPLLLSLKPHYADLIFRKLKIAELRRRIAPAWEDRNVYVYVSSPKQSLHGGFRVEHVWEGTPEAIWNQVSKYAGIEKKDFDDYYAGCSVAYALKIADVWKYREPFSLSALRSRFPSFAIPQSWRYVTPEEEQLFRGMPKSICDTARKADKAA